MDKGLIFWILLLTCGAAFVFGRSEIAATFLAAAMVGLATAKDD